MNRSLPGRELQAKPITSKGLELGVVVSGGAWGGGPHFPPSQPGGRSLPQPRVLALRSFLGATLAVPWASASSLPRRLWGLTEMDGTPLVPPRRDPSQHIPHGLGHQLSQHLFLERGFIAFGPQLVFHIISWSQGSWVGAGPREGLGVGVPVQYLVAGGGVGERGQVSGGRSGPGFASTTQNSTVPSGPQEIQSIPTHKTSRDCGLAVSQGTYFLPSTPCTVPAQPPEKKKKHLSLVKTACNFCGHRNHKLLSREDGRGDEATGNLPGPVPLPARGLPRTPPARPKACWEPGCRTSPGRTPTPHAPPPEPPAFPTDPRGQRWNMRKNKTKTQKNPKTQTGR